MIKSLRRIGRLVLDRTARRSAIEPSKCASSVRTEIAQAPPRSYWPATSPGETSARMIPADGDLRLNSAIIFGHGDSKINACNRRCGPAVFRISSACSRRRLEEGLAFIRVITWRVCTRISEKKFLLIDLGLSRE